ncbi:MAG TPA: alpha/beta fold hydrolase [Actinospica sp.]|nr:alpha/beta fold hydrolase [Actinospica sp.]
MKYFTTGDEPLRLNAATRRELRGSFSELSDGVTHYELTGPVDGEIAVLIGGLMIPLSYWDATAAELHERGIRTLALSCYGRGYSDRVQARYDETLFARQLSELVERLGLTRPVHLVGTSMGALIAMAYAEQHAASIATLSIIGPAGLLPRTRKSPDRMLRSDLVAGFVARRRGRKLLEEHLGHNIDDPKLSADLAAIVLDAYQYEGSLYAFFDTLQHLPLSGRTEVFRRTGALGLPTLLIWGADDKVTPATNMDTARDLLHAKESHLITDCGHMVPFERPREIAEQIAAFATSHTTERQES